MTALAVTARFPATISIKSGCSVAELLAHGEGVAGELGSDRG